MKKILFFLMLPVLCFGQKCITGNCENGQGTYTWLDGNKYEGEWKDGYRNGEGTFTWSKGDKYVGEWKDNKKNGQGTATWTDGNKYVGEWKDNETNGQGTFIMQNGDKYEGEWKDGHLNGQGTYYGKTKKYVGEWKDDKWNGQGTYFTYTLPKNRIEYIKSLKAKGKNRNEAIEILKTWDIENRVGDLTYVCEWMDNKPYGQGTIINEKCEVSWFTNDFSNENRIYKVSWPHVEYSFVRLGESLNIDFNKIIIDYVTYKVNEWQKKGEFEKIADYNVRVNEASRKKIIEKHQNEAIDELEHELLRSVNFKKITLNDYDAENETFLLSSNYIGDFVLNVPIDNAPLFKQNFNSVEFKDQEFILSNNKFILSALKVVDKDGNEFTYNNQNQSTYSQTKIDYNFSDIEINIPNQVVKQNNIVKQTNKISVGKPDVDMDIPLNNKKNPHRYALIIGNEDYSSFQTDLSSEVNVDYAVNDAKVFSEYCEKTLGVDSRHLKLLTNATYGQMKQAIAWVQNLSDIEGGNAEIIFYYSGHGLPNEVTKEGYLMPVDVSGNNVSNGISLKYLYQELNKYPAKEITVVLDACFSGGARNEGLIAMKGVKINPKEEVFLGNMVVFASSSGSESSAVYREKQHGYLTYFLLKKIQETKGYVNYKDLSDYLDYQVRKETALIGKVQTPKVNVSPSAKDQWKYWSFR